MARATSKKVIFELYWSSVPVHVPGAAAAIQTGHVINIRVRRSSDITFDNQQGYANKQAALDTIRGHVEQIAGISPMEELIKIGRIKITGPGKKPS